MHLPCREGETALSAGRCATTPADPGWQSRAIPTRFRRVPGPGLPGAGDPAAKIMCHVVLGQRPQLLRARPLPRAARASSAHGGWPLRANGRNYGASKTWCGRPAWPPVPHCLHHGRVTESSPTRFGERGRLFKGRPIEGLVAVFRSAPGPRQSQNTDPLFLT